MAVAGERVLTVSPRRRGGGFRMSRNGGMAPILNEASEVEISATEDSGRAGEKHVAFPFDCLGPTGANHSNGEFNPSGGDGSNRGSTGARTGGACLPGPAFK